MYPGTTEKKAREVKGTLLFALALLFCSWILVPPLRGQTASTGALTVTVTDPSGAAIAGATVTVTNNAGLSRTGKTGADGSYTFPLLPPGSYKVDVSQTGFKIAEIPAVTVEVASTSTVSQALQLGTQQQSVTVTAAAPTIQTETSTLGGVVASEAITGLPLAARNYTQILSLSPGVVTTVYNGTQLGLGSQDLEANGQSNVSNSFSMDGVTVSDEGSNELNDPDNFWGSTPIPSPDAIQEFNVQTSSFDAGYGRNSGANVNVVTKSGTNSWHGTLFEYLRNDDLNANGFFQNESSLARGELKQNQFGGVLGGPIKKNKAFFFFSYEGTRQRNGVSPEGFDTAELPEQLTNDRTASALGAEFCPANNPPGSPGYQFAHTLFGGTQVDCDGSNISPVALAMLNAKGPNGEYFIASPTLILNPGTPNAVGLLASSIPSTFHDNQVLLNIDYLLTPKQTLSAKYFYDYNPTTKGFSTFTGNCVPVGCGGHFVSGNTVASLDLTSVLTDNLVNDARVSYFYIRAFGEPTDPFTAQQFGITPNVSFFPFSPVVSISGLFTAGGEFVDGSNSPQDSYQWSEQLSWTHGRHAIRFGYGGDFEDSSDYFPAIDRGQLTFLSFADFLVGESAAQNGTPFSNVFSAFARVTEPNFNNYTRQNLQDLFVQDDFKVSKRLTLNLGLRWEYDGIPYDTHGADFNAEYNLLSTVPIPPVAGTYVGYTMPNNYTGTVPLPAGAILRSTNTSATVPLDSFAPRLGFAWQPFERGRFVVRGGYGLFYNVVNLNPFIVQMDSTPPFANTASLFGASNGACSFENPFCEVPPLGFPLRTPTSELSFSEQAIGQPLLNPRTQSYHLDIQYLLKPSWLLQVGYAGNMSKHQWSSEGLDAPELATATTPVNCGNPVTGCITTNTAANAPERVPILGIAPYGYSAIGNFGSANYNSLEVVLKKTISHGLQFQASYTYGRTFADYTGTELHGAGGEMDSNNPLDLAQLYGPADWQRPQRLVVSYLYKLPSYHAGQGWDGRLLSGWGISGVTTLQDGLPLTLTDSAGGAVYGSDFSRAQFCPGMTARNLATPGSVSSRLNDFINEAAIADTPESPAGCTFPIVGAISGVGGATGFGNTGRGLMLGPGQQNWDISISKDTHVTEAGELQFRADFFNAFNHSQFSNPGTAVGTSTFGVITSTAVGPRILQFGLKYVF
jgi:carboxypeptidase family protein